MLEYLEDMSWTILLASDGVSTMQTSGGTPIGVFGATPFDTGALG